MQRARGICRYLLCSSLLSVIVEIKSLLVAYECHMSFWTLIVILVRKERQHTREVEEAHQNFVLACVNFASLGDIRLRSGAVWRKRL